MACMSTQILKKDFDYMSSTKKQSNGRKENVAMRKAVLFFGGTVKLSEHLGVHNAHISRWLYGSRRIPIKHALQIEVLTRGSIKAMELRPDINWPFSLNNKE